ncbi:unnamed protein product [Anisakis simplex]|uniref:7TM_GPCR_Srx domain-containing protein n=1 Tax=Anisakis simplex TaxID=6269 RepID=A0A0M3K567_ANISI|nr:unnamed protein product [Anisakis simplex]
MIRANETGQVIIIIFMAIPSAFSLIWLTPYATYGFNATLVMWEYESPDFMPAFDRINTLTCSALSGICYLLIVIDVIRKGSAMTSKNHRREILITIQVMLNGGYTLAVSIYFMFLRPYYVPYTVFYNATDIALCLIWNGKSPIMHLIFNREIRLKFIAQLKEQSLSWKAIKAKFSTQTNAINDNMACFKPAHSRNGRIVY